MLSTWPWSIGPLDPYPTPWTSKCFSTGTLVSLSPTLASFGTCPATKNHRTNHQTRAPLTHRPTTKTTTSRTTQTTHMPRSTTTSLLLSHLHLSCYYIYFIFVFSYQPTKHHTINNSYSTCSQCSWTDRVPTPQPNRTSAHPNPATSSHERKPSWC